MRTRQLRSVRIGNVMSGSGGRSSRLVERLTEQDALAMNQRANSEGSIYRRQPRAMSCDSDRAAQLEPLIR
jgi:hypothetical protein